MSHRRSSFPEQFQADSPEKTQVILIQSALVIAALSTLLQLFPIGGKAKFAIGSGLPIIMGVSFAYVPSMQAIAESYGIAAIMGAEIVGGIVAVVMGLLVKKIRVFFPPLITGTVVFTIGLSLYPTAINYMAGGTQPVRITDPGRTGQLHFSR